MKRNLEPTARKANTALQSSVPVGADADRDAALRVLALEADGIRTLAGSLDGSFSLAVEILAKVGRPGSGGRVVVSGMGKSGHIARKIAATLASTGTPAQFVHPAEASHGDLGMITAMDAVLCLSNSGETPELGDLVAHAKRFDVPLIGIVGRAGSTLAQAANVALVLPPVPEACPLGLAPMTSTTVMLALGDALAAALLERKGFTPEQFQVLHPGGKLGKALIKVGDIMHTGDDVPLLRLGTAMREAILTMSAKGFGCVGIVDAADTLVGIITDGDLRRHIDDDILARTVDEVMTRMPKTIRPQALAAEALGQMNANKITALFVTEDSRLKGIVRVHDILRAGVA
jgi:arabinose-5-phosphate isomerase